MALLATLQYQWLGRISAAERESRRCYAQLAATAAFASDFDQRAHARLHDVPGRADARRLGSRQTISAAALPSATIDGRPPRAIPRLIKEYFLAARENDGSLTAPVGSIRPRASSSRPSGRKALVQLRKQMTVHDQAPAGEPRQEPGTFVLRIDDEPAVGRGPGARRPDAADAVQECARGRIARHAVRRRGSPSRCSRSMATSCGRRCCRRSRSSTCAASATASTISSRSSVRPDGARFITPMQRLQPDAGCHSRRDSADLFQVRPQEFAQMAADVQRFTMAVPVPQQGQHDNDG